MYNIAPETKISYAYPSLELALLRLSSRRREPRHALHTFDGSEASRIMGGASPDVTVDTFNGAAKPVAELARQIELEGYEED